MMTDIERAYDAAAMAEGWYRSNDGLWHHPDETRDALPAYETAREICEDRGIETAAS